MNPPPQSHSVPKRPRESSAGNSSNYDEVQDVLDSIQQALTTKQRLATLWQLRQSVTAKDSSTESSLQQTSQVDIPKINSFVQAGVLPALALQLGYCLQRQFCTPQEIQLLLQTIDLFLRCSSDVEQQKEVLIHKLGRSFVELVVQAVHYCRSSAAAVTFAVSILHCLSGSVSGTLLISKCRPGLLWLVELLKMLRGSNKDLSADDAEAILLDALGCLKNLTYFGEDCRSELLHVPGLSTALTDLPPVLLSSTNCNSKALERLSAVWRNLAVSPNTRVLLAQQPDMLTVLSELVSTQQQITSSNRSTVLRNVLKTLVSLAMEVDSAILIIFHGDGILLKAMKRLLIDDTDAVVRQRAARTLRLLVSESSAPVLIHDVDLMDRLSHIALHDDSPKVRLEAAEAFARCASLVQSPMPQHQAILEALVHLANCCCSHRTVSMNVLARVLKEQASHVNNRAPMVHRDPLLEALASIALSAEASRMAKDDVCSALKDLATEESNRVLLATPRILEALVHSTTVSGRSTTTVVRGTRRENAVLAMVYLASLAANRTKMVNHGNLLQSLIHFCATATGSNTKDQVKKVIVMLVSEI